MIFNVPDHIEMIRNGLSCIKPSAILYHPMPLRIVKTETRRPNRGIYQVEAERKKPHKIGYAVQCKRGVSAEPDIRIVMDRIWEEQITPPYDIRDNLTYSIISEESAWAEGGYTPEEFEKLFRKINPNWYGIIRYGFGFHAIKVQT